MRDAALKTLGHKKRPRHEEEDEGTFGEDLDSDEEAPPACPFLTLGGSDSSPETDRPPKKKKPQRINAKTLMQQRIAQKDRELQLKEEELRLAKERQALEAEERRAIISWIQKSTKVDWSVRCTAV